MHLSDFFRIGLLYFGGQLTCVCKVVSGILIDRVTTAMKGCKITLISRKIFL